MEGVPLGRANNHIKTFQQQTSFFVSLGGGMGEALPTPRPPISGVYVLDEDTGQDVVSQWNKVLERVNDRSDEVVVTLNL